MTRLAVRAVLVSTTIFGLAACEDGINLGQGGGENADSAAPASIAAREGGVRDIERPDIFNTTEEALWDGRPSLGGIWVAHPDVTTPERAIVTNNTTNQRIAAALFRRERANPGPRVQLSSDAAAALNILAGAPTEVTIVAVRQEEVEVEEQEPVISDEAVGEDTPDSTAEDGADVAAAAAATEAAQAEEAAPRRGNFLQRLFGGNRRSATAAGAAAATEESLEATAEAAAAPAVETQTLDPVASGAAAAIAAADADDKPAPRPARQTEPAEPEAEPEAETEPAPATPAPEAPAPLQNPFVQVGLYSVEANAFSARDNLRTAGIVPTVFEGSNDNGPFWRVVVGPVTTKDDQAEILAQVKRLGFSDAFLTSE